MPELEFLDLASVAVSVFVDCRLTLVELVVVFVSDANFVKALAQVFVLEVPVSSRFEFPSDPVVDSWRPLSLDDEEPLVEPLLLESLFSLFAL